MSLLPPESTEFPDDLLQLRDERDGGRRWYVLHTRPRQEKCLTRQLLELRVPHYLPLLPRRRRFRKRVMTSYLPLFPSYVSIFANDAERTTALRTRRVVQCLDVINQQQFFVDLCQVRTLIGSGVPILPEERLMPGDFVEIRSGPLRGLQGVIWRACQGQRRFTVKVDFLQRGASVVADDFELKVLSSHPLKHTKQ